jgi:ubiquinone/menaquinone biosynthesis C-methylase UbiE
MADDHEHDDKAEEKQRIADAYGRAAAIFDRVGPRVFSYFGQWLVEQAGVRAGERVLDVASGRGAALLPASQAAGAQGLVVGIDLSDGMIKALAEEVRDQQRTNVGVCVMDAERLEFPDDSFDCVLCGFALFFFPHLEQALAEMRRVLRPGGRLAVTTWDKSGDEGWEWYSDLVHSYLPPPDAREPGQPGPVLDEPQGLAAALRAASFQDVQVSTKTLAAAFRDEEEWWTARWSHGGRMKLEQIEAQGGAEALGRFKEQAFRGLQSMKTAGGVPDTSTAICAVGRK